MSKIISIYIIGPTGSGKSSLSIQVAKAFGGEIISADSRQIYRGLDIGTGKENGRIAVCKKRGKYTEKAYMVDGIPHYMIDTHHPNTVFSAGKFIRKAKNIQKDIWQRGKIPIICGGTHFWAQSLLEGASMPEVVPNPILRGKLAQASTESLLRRLEKADPVRAEVIVGKNEINNRPRLIRAIEIAEALGTVPKLLTPDYTLLTDNNLIIATNLSDDILLQKIRKRMDNWFKSGLLREIVSAHENLGVPWVRLESFGLEYKWSVRYIRGQVTEKEMHERTLSDLRKFAKRQKTWIKRWAKQGAQIHPHDNFTNTKKLIRTFLSD